MNLIELNCKPTDRQLRQFAIMGAIVLPLLGWITGLSIPVIGLLAAVGLLTAVCGLVVPQTVRPIFLALVIAATPIGMVIGELAMLVVYFGVFLPIGLIFRLLNRDALQMKIDPNAKTYWQAKRQPNGAASYYRQS